MPSISLLHGAPRAEPWKSIFRYGSGIRRHVARGEFLEYARFSEHFTARHLNAGDRGKGLDLVLEIDVQARPR